MYLTEKLFMAELCFFFFKQKTAYEIRKGDWSSDVCSSDLGDGSSIPTRYPPATCQTGGRSEERRVGKSVLPCVDLGGRRIIKKKKKKVQNNSIFTNTLNIKKKIKI